MRIAQVAPLWESVPPSGYGAVESVVADLTEGLVERGHGLTVFASGDSKITADLAAVQPRALHAATEIAEPEVYRLRQAVEVIDRSDEFDVIHSHIHSNTGCLGIPMLTGARTPVVHTVHCFFNEDNSPLFRRFAAQNYVAISHDQRRRLPDLNYVGIVHHGIAVSRFPFVARPQDQPYLASLGRIRPEKGVHLAIDLARRVGLPLKLAGRVKRQDGEYFERRIQPHLDTGEVVFMGELDFVRKTALLGGAAAFLALSGIPEPFGLTTVESMACGTPVLALDNGAIRELVEDGRTGFIRTWIRQLAEAAGRIHTIDRQTCRSHVAEHFSAARMVEQYEAIFLSIVRGRLNR